MAYTFSTDWFTAHEQTWLEHVVPRIPRPCSWLEIGSHEGRSAVFMLDRVLSSADTLVCVDTWAGPFDGFAATDAELRFDANVAGRAEKHKATSLDFLAASVLAGRQFDGVYIDGDHAATSVLTDSVLAWHVLRPGGVIVWDDYGYSRGDQLPPRLAIDRVLELYGERLTVLHIGWQVIAEKYR